MRIIAWNANYVGHPKRTFKAAADLLFDAGADLAIISEVARPPELIPGQLDWIGAGGPGLGVVVRKGYTIRRARFDSPPPSLFGGYRIRGPVDLNLVAAWPVRNRQGPSCGKLLNEALMLYGEFLQGGRSVLAGDLNSSTGVKSQRTSHPAFVKRARALGLESAYHHLRGVDHGQETEPTYRHGDSGKGKFHIDYCFLSLALLSGAQVQILNGPLWEKRSDHFPVVVDLNLSELIRQAAASRFTWQDGDIEFTSGG